MGSEYGELLADFDLGFLNSSNNEVLGSAERLEKLRKAIFIAKTKTIATDSLLKRYYEKKEALDLAGKALFESKMECKQVCIEYRNAVEQIGTLEENEKKLQDAIRNLEDRNLLLENQYSALQSHAHQLQELSKSHEKKINSLEIDNEADKFSLKESEKTISNLEKSELSLKDLIATLKDIVLGKGVLDPKTKSRLKQFSKSDAIKLDDTECEKDCDWINDDPDDDEVSQGTNTVSLIKITDIEENHVLTYTEMDRCAEITSSVDTGRGSSLASDSGKCIYSPDQVSNDSLIDINPLKRHKPVKCQDAATSPIHFTTQIECTSPINSEPTKHLMKKPYDVPPLPAKTIQDNDLAVKQTQKECLEVNAKNFNDNYDDIEVSSIFKELQLHFDMVTPIPATPSLAIRATAKEVNNCDTVYSEIAKVREENQALQSSLADLVKKLSGLADLPKRVSEIEMMLSQNNGIGSINTSVKLTQCVGSNTDKDLTEDFDCDNYAPDDPLIVIELDNRSEDASDEELGTDLVTIPSLQSAFAEEVEGVCNPPNKEVTTIAERIRFLDSSDNNDVNSVNKVPVNISDSTKICDIEINEKEGNIDDEKDKKRQIRKMRITKLEKMRLRLQPKCKIKTPLGPLITKKKPCIRPLANAKKVNTQNSDSRNLNDTAVYEKALAVVAEIRAKNKQEQERVIRRRTLPPRKARASHNETKDDLLQKTPEKQTDPKRDIRFSELRVSLDRLPLIDSNGLSPQKYNMSPPKYKNMSPPKYNNMSPPKYNNNNKVNIEINGISPLKYGNNIAKSFSDATSLTPRTTRSRTKGKEVNKYEDIWNKAPTKRPSTEDLIPDSSSKRQLRSSIRTPNSANSSMDLVRASNKNNSYTNASRKANRHSTSYADQDMFEVCDDKDKVEGEPSPIIQKDVTPVKRRPTIEKGVTHVKPSPVMQKEVTPVKPCKDKESSMKQSILCKMIDKYGVRAFRKKKPKQIPDNVVQKVFNTLTRGVETAVNAESNEAKTAMNLLVEELKRVEYKLFMLVFMKYLQDPDRKMELLSMTCTPPLPPMSKTEQVLLYVISQLNHHWPDITLINEVLQNIEYHIFRLNKTPDFAMIDTLSHLYAVLCRFSKAKNKLRLFMLDAMYCIGYKAVPLIRQCINVWMHVLPLPHMRSAKNPLVICLIYLLHFYRCEDKYHKVQEMRTILQRKYCYELSEWNEAKIIEQFQTSIMEMRDNKTELSILRVAIVIYAKRLGPRWCEKNIIKNLLVPIITNEKNAERIRRYCISLLGPLVRPFPPEMKVNSEIIMNQLIDMLDHNLSHTLQEAVYSSLLYINKHDHRRVTRALLNWKPERPLSPDLEQLLRNFVQDRPVKQWVEILTRHNS